MTDAALLSVLDSVDPPSAAADEPVIGALDVAQLAAIDGAEEQLVAVAGDASAPAVRRYAAAEALVEGTFDGWRSSPAAAASVAAALAAAMRSDTSHNRWGLPGHFAGRLGEELLSLPAGVEDALLPLLDDASPLMIEGSEAATIATDAGYRISDLAAYLLSLHRGLPADAPAAVAKRDRANAALARELGT